MKEAIQTYEHSSHPDHAVLAVLKAADERLDALEKAVAAKKAKKDE